ncbi:MAG: hypothetical protein HY672_00935 [Chloroflexi bacterium]|nr:hypothetical protein [Chloroflexota bacterium]
MSSNERTQAIKCGWANTPIYSDTRMNSRQNVDEIEAKVSLETKRKETKTLARIEALLNAFLHSFRETGGFTPTTTNRHEQVWWLLVGRSFNSLRWAFHLLQVGYYTQALILVRSVEEDWLVCQDCLEHPDTVEALFDDSKRMPTFQDMANRLPENLRNTWHAPKGHPEQAYDILSSISHPRPRALRFAFDFGKNSPRIGPGYDESLFVFTSWQILTAAICIAAFLARLVSEEFQKPLMNEMQQATEYLETLRHRAEKL